MFEIEKDIPTPKHRARQAYPFKQMEVGDSFFIPSESDSFHAKAVASLASKRFAPKRFVSRKVDGGRRIWRVQ